MRGLFPIERQRSLFAMNVAPGFAGTVSPNSNQPATAAVLER
jgi:hypothetical protein